MKINLLYCPKHPDGLIDHHYDLTQCVLNGYPSGEGVKSNHKYFCHDCGVELKSLSEVSCEEMAAKRIQDDFEKAASNLLNGWGAK